MTVSFHYAPSSAPKSLGIRLLRGLASHDGFAILSLVKATEVIQALAALASESRLAVFRLLVKRGPEGFTPSELSEHLQVPAPTLSFHLKELVRAGLVNSHREGRNLYYAPNIGHMKLLVGFLTENCCSLADAACGEDCKPVTSPIRQRVRRRA